VVFCIAMTDSQSAVFFVVSVLSTQTRDTARVLLRGTTRSGSSASPDAWKPPACADSSSARAPSCCLSTSIWRRGVPQLRHLSMSVETFSQARLENPPKNRGLHNTSPCRSVALCRTLLRIVAACRQAAGLGTKSASPKRRGNCLLPSSSTFVEIRG